jgi:hypothetical protein
MPNEQQGAEKTAGEGDEQAVAEGPIIGLDNRSVMVLHKYPKNNSCECRETKSHAAQSHLQGVFISQKAHSF